MSEDLLCNIGSLKASSHKQHQDNSFVSGLKDSISICIPAMVLFYSIGLHCHNAKLGVLQSALLTMAIFSTPAEIAILHGIHHHASLLGVGFIIFALNFRLFIASTLLVPYLQNLGKVKYFFVALILTSTNAAVVYLAFMNKNVANRVKYYLGVSLPNYLISIVFTVIGYTFSISNNPVLSATMSMVLPLTFAALTAKRYPNKIAILATLLGYIGTGFLADFNSSLIETLLACAIGLLVMFFESKPKHV